MILQEKAKIQYLKVSGVMYKEMEDQIIILLMKNN